VASGSQASHLVRVRRLQALTIVWMSAEAGLSLWAAWRAKSPALLAFGGDSAIELLSAAVVLWRFQDERGDENTERRAGRIAGVLLVMLAVYVVAVSAATMLGYALEPAPSYLGIGILSAAMVIMPWLAWQKRRLSVALASPALRADAAESMLCAYLSFVALVGLSSRAFLHISWADPISAMAIVPLIVLEARRAFLGKPCGCAGTSM
jgi:divalent metal cation (Fe/Co/Zn/Cd) transporter